LGNKFLGSNTSKLSNEFFNKRSLFHFQIFKLPNQHIMRIGFDAKRMLNNPTGLGNHARILANGLMRDYADNEYMFFAAKAKDTFFHQLHGDFQVHFPETKWAQSAPALWRSYGITDDLLRHRVEIYHGISNELPFNIKRSGIRSVVTIHDLIFLKHKEQYPWLDRQVYIAKTRYAAKHADAIIAVSEETKRDLIEMYGVPEKKITVIYPSVDPAFDQKASEKERQMVVNKYNLPKQFILNVGSFFPRKNQMKLLEAFALIKDKVVEDLVLIGSAGNMLPQIKALIANKQLESRVHIIKTGTNEDLPVIYQSAGVFVFPSVFEGFGAPVLEALFSGVPVVATKGGAIEEAAGATSLFINPNDAGEIAEKIVSVLNDKMLSERMVDTGYHHAQTMTDSTFASKTMEVYKKL
jgi:glycosyltransferase involved in cell wall biosynthesis